VQKNKTSSRNSDFQLELDSNEKLSRRRTNLLPDGAYFFEDDLEIKDVFGTTVITSAAWLIEFFELRAGEIFFHCGEEQIRLSKKCFGVFHPPFSIVRFSFVNASGRVKGIAATEILPPDLRAAPLVFETDYNQTPENGAQAIKFLLSGENRQSIEAFPKASLISLKAKKLIDENYLASVSIARIAVRLKVSHAYLSRQFKQDFAMSPSDYLRRLRMADAPLLLARGEAIIDVSQAVGYNDLSRFYKQFRQTTNTSPGVCKTIMKPNQTQ
jgi:AraC-like DNA-binding protein